MKLEQRLERSLSTLLANERPWMCVRLVNEEYLGARFERRRNQRKKTKCRDMNRFLHYRTRTNLVTNIECEKPNA